MTDFETCKNKSGMIKIFNDCNQVSYNDFNEILLLFINCRKCRIADYRLKQNLPIV